MFVNIFKSKERKEKVLRNTLQVKKLAKATQFLLPETWDTLVLGDRLLLSQLEDTKEIIIVKVNETMPEDFIKNASDYVVAHHSFNNQRAADKIREVFGIDEVEFELNCELRFIEGIEVLILLNPCVTTHIKELFEDKVEDKVGNLIEENETLL